MRRPTRRGVEADFQRLRLPCQGSTTRRAPPIPTIVTIALRTGMSILGEFTRCTRSPWLVGGALLLLVPACFSPESAEVPAGGDSMTGSTSSTSSASLGTSGSGASMTSEGSASMTSMTSVGTGNESTDGETTAATGSSGEMPDSCDRGQMCVPVPPGWLGPVQVVQPDLGETCSPSFTDSFDLLVGLSAPQATCGCACGPVEADCSDVTLLQGSGGPCLGVFSAPIPGPGGCTVVPQAQVCGRGLFSAPPASPSCVPTPSIAVQPPTWQSSLRVCEGSLPTLDCDAGQSCFPMDGATALAPVCIYSGGEMACPPDFPVAFPAFTGVDDDRGCSACGCGAPPANQLICSTELHIYGDLTCTVQTGQITVTGNSPSAAAFGTSPTMSVNWDVPTVAGPGCGPSGGQPSGEAVPTGGVSICCRPHLD